jgi:hypothetical protein
MRLDFVLRGKGLRAGAVSRFKNGQKGNRRSPYATSELARSQVLVKEVEGLEQTVTLTNEDIHRLRLAGDALEDRAGEF